MAPITALQELHTDTKLLFDLAAGVESLDDIADRYGLAPEMLLTLIERPNIRRAIKERKKELDDTGYSMAAKAKLCFEDLLGDVYKKSKKEDASLSALLASAEFFRRVAGLDKQDVNKGDNEKFSISINLGNPAATSAQNITVTVTEAQKTTVPDKFTYDANADVEDVSSVDSSSQSEFAFTTLPDFIMPDAATTLALELALPEGYVSLAENT